MEECSILWCGKYQQNWENKLHHHGFCQLFAISRGTGIVTIGDSRWIVQPKEIYLVKPDEPHSVVCSGASLLGMYDIKFTIGGVELAEGVSGLPSRIVSTHFDRFDSRFEKIVRESIDARQYYFQIINHCLFDILASLIRENRGDSSLDEYSDGGSELPGREVSLAPLLEYISANYTRAITLDELCAIASFNKTTLTELFREQLNTTPIRYVNQIRLRRAKALLTDTALPIGEVASLSGFQSVHYFCRTFKAAEGIPPAQYRQTRSGSYFFKYSAEEDI